MDENEFFRQMTMRICSSLDMETALRRSLDYLVDVLPVERIFLHLYEKKVGSIQTIAEVTIAGSRILDKVTPLTREGRASLERPGVPNVRIVNRPDHDPVMKTLAVALGIPASSSLLMRLVIEGERLGTLALCVSGLDCYTEEHARLLALLNEPFAMALSNALTHQQVLKLKDMLTDDNRYLHQELFSLAGSEIIGMDFGLKEVMEMVRKVAPLESPVLLLGDTGVGKGVMAGAIHRLSGRSRGPFITVNSGAIPETLIDSELFGHEKGAFTGAIEQKRGRFERANQGTIFLDEIGELPLPAQIRMLRVLQERVIERVGGASSIPVDIRIIAATHRDLHDMVRTGRFREDLWFRINVFPIRIPPLRERREDIPSLLYYFMNKKAGELKLPAIPGLSPGAVDRLMNYDWPGNVRELENVVEREMILDQRGPLAFRGLLQAAPINNTVSGDQEVNKHPEGPLDLDEVGARHIRRVLTMTRGIVHGPQGAAARLGINPSTLRSRMKKLGILYGKKYRQDLTCRKNTLLK
ncbi:MAG: sigma 54-interacting transcriptional regulator [Syntrophales bacterium]